MSWLRDIIFLGLCSALMVFIGTTTRPLTRSSEGRVARVAQEMIDSGDWVVPHLNGVVRLEKPPLTSWLVAGVTKLSGSDKVTPLHAYIPPGIATVLLILLIYVWMRQAAPADDWSSWRGVFAGLMLMAAPGFFLQARSAEMDMELALAVTLAFWGFWKHRTSGCVGALMIAYAALALTIHIKGHVGLVVCVPAVLIWNFVERSRGALPLPSSGRLKWHALGLLIIAIAVIPFGIHFIQQSGLTWERFNREGLGGRFGSDVPHAEPFYFYLYSVPGWFLPWTLLLVFGLWQTRDLPPDGRSPLRRLCWIWLGWNMLLFSVISSKQRHYAIPFMPPVAILIADVFLRWRTHFDPKRAKASTITITVFSVIFAIAVFAPPVLTYRSSGSQAGTSVPHTSEMATIVGIWTVAVIASSVFLFAAARARVCGSAVYLLWSGFVCATVLFSRTLETKDFNSSPERFCVEVSRLVPRDAELYDFDVALPRREGKSRPVWRAQVLFYLGRKVEESEQPISELKNGAYAIATEKRLQELSKDRYEILVQDDSFLGHKNDVYLIRVK